MLFYAETAHGFDIQADKIFGFLDESVRMDVVLSSGRDKSWNGHDVLPLPGSFGFLFGPFLSLLNVRAIVAVSPLPEKLARAAASRATPVLDGGASQKDILAAAGRERKWEERRNRPLGRFLAEKIYARLEKNNGVAGGITRLTSVGELTEKLYNPKTILCLGNGPSSEDAAVHNVSFDVLFRANHGWQSRGFLTHPDVVFTGMQASMRKLKEPILCVLGTTTEKVLLMVRARNFLSGKLTYLAVGTPSVEPGLKGTGDVRPTSGAVMLAVAVAMAPEKLIIAGMDLFQHPQGSYPGDASAPNAYTATHSRDHELEFILTRLERYEGDLVIVSDALRQAWEVHKKVSRSRD